MINRKNFCPEDNNTSCGRRAGTHTHTHTHTQTHAHGCLNYTGSETFKQALWSSRRRSFDMLNRSLLWLKKSYLAAIEDGETDSVAWCKRWNMKGEQGFLGALLALILEFIYDRKRDLRQRQFFPPPFFPISCTSGSLWCNRHKGATFKSCVISYAPVHFKKKNLRSLPFTFRRRAMLCYITFHRNDVNSDVSLSQESFQLSP